ncbi:hypothetical protein ES703_29084 [subsurface metagenome]
MQKTEINLLLIKSGFLIHLIMKDGVVDQRERVWRLKMCGVCSLVRVSIRYLLLVLQKRI